VPAVTDQTTGRLPALCWTMLMETISFGYSTVPAASVRTTGPSRTSVASFTR
jgi:hypothetical protein